MNKRPWYGYVYLLQSGDHYKIGFSDKPQTRIKQIRTGSPHPTFLIHSLKTQFYRQIEKQLHNRFAEKRALGEWFLLTDQDVAYIKSLDSKGRTPSDALYANY